MVIVKSKLSKKDQERVNTILKEVSDSYNDFYITENNLRLFIKDNSYLLFKNLNKGDKIAFDDNGIAVLTGFSDKSPRKYLKVLAKDEKNTYNLVRVLVEWNYNNIDIYAKMKKNNPLVKILRKSGFRFKAGRGREVLMVRQAKKEIKNVR